jgi:hypothetical protein
MVPPNAAAKANPAGDARPGMEQATQAARPVATEGPAAEPIPVQPIDVRSLPAQPAAAHAPPANTASTGAGAPRSDPDTPTQPAITPLAMTASRDAPRSGTPPVTAH